MLHFSFYSRQTAQSQFNQPEHTEQSRRCPLCSQSMGEHLIHRIRSKYDYQKYYLTPLRTSPPPLQPLAGRRSAGRTGRGRRTEREWGGRRVRDDREQADQLDRAIARRRWIYEHDIYAKVRSYNLKVAVLIPNLAFPLPACCLQCVYTIPPVSHPGTVFCFAGID